MIQTGFPLNPNPKNVNIILLLQLFSTPFVQRKIQKMSKNLQGVII